MVWVKHKRKYDNPEADPICLQAMDERCDLKINADDLEQNDKTHLFGMYSGR